MNYTFEGASGRDHGGARRQKLQHGGPHRRQGRQEPIQGKLN